MTDGELLAEYVEKGSEDAFGRIVERHSQRVYAACLRTLNDPAAAEDAAQGTFLVLVRRAGSIPAGTSLAGWLFMTARNVSLNLRKVRARRARREKEAAAMRSTGTGKAGGDLDLARPRLDAALAALPARQREAVLLRYAYGKSQAETAAEMGCSVGAVSSAASMGLEKLRSRLVRVGIALPAAALGGLLAEGGAVTVPAGLAAGIKAACLGAAAASPTALAAAEGAIRSLSIAKLKLAGLAVCALTAAAGGALAVAGAFGGRGWETLAEIPERRMVLISEGHRGDVDVSQVGGMVYDRYRHKLLAFGGGDGTTNFPDSVHQFDLENLRWEQLTPDVPPEAYLPENAVLTPSGEKTGGIRWEGRVQPGSRRGNDGLVMAADAPRMICVQYQGGIGARARHPRMNGEAGGHYRDHYRGGSALWIFDPAAREWTHSARVGLAVPFAMSAVNPRRPELVYVFNSYRNDARAVNWRTGEAADLAKRPHSAVNHCVAYCPGRHSLLDFPCEAREASKLIQEYDLASNRWEVLRPEGDLPKTYGRNVVYDSRNRVFVCLDAGRVHYYSRPENRWYRLEESLPVQRAGYRHVYVPGENVHIILSGSAWKTWAYKLSDEPGDLPGAGLPEEK